MDEFPKKRKTYSIDLYIGGSGSFSAELPVEWDVLAAASDRCLVGRARGFVEREIVRTTPASSIWRLWQEDLGEFGTFEVRKIRPGCSQITFSGLGLLAGFPDKKREIKLKQHMRDIIDTYYFLLSQENIFTDGALLTKPLEERPPQPHILDGKENKRDIEIVELWCSGATGSFIAEKVCLGRDTVYNIISKLRRKYPDAKIPRDRERKPMRF